ncbi:MAG: hypothetical protein DBX53_00675 [Clostridiales bacterium]|nr:MAG: hypothetical protein DBX53_00675 [Clostridiales bacterium]
MNRKQLSDGNQRCLIRITVRAEALRDSVKLQPFLLLFLLQKDFRCFYFIRYVFCVKIYVIAVIFFIISGTCRCYRSVKHK